MEIRVEEHVQQILMNSRGIHIKKILSPNLFF